MKTSNKEDYVVWRSTLEEEMKMKQDTILTCIAPFKDIKWVKLYKDYEKDGTNSYWIEWWDTANHQTLEILDGKNDDEAKDNFKKWFKEFEKEHE